MALTDLQAPPVTVATLFADGLTLTEISAATGLQPAMVVRELGAAGLGPAHAARLELAAYEAALPGVTWREASDKLGGTVRLESERPANPALLTMLLKAHKAETYGEAAGDGMRLVVDRMGYLRARLPDLEGEVTDVTPDP